MSRLTRYKALRIIVLWVALYLLFSIIYISLNPIDWKITGMIIVLMVGGAGTKQYINGQA
jgi:hypothetical protein